MINRATVFSANLSAMADGEFAIVPSPVPDSMAKPPENPYVEEIERLAEYVKRVKTENHQTFEAIAKLAKGSIGTSTVQQLATAGTPNPGIFTLLELSRGLSRPVGEVLEILLDGNTTESPTFKRGHFATLADLYERLPISEQRVWKRYLQIMEREMRRVLMQLTETDLPQQK